MSSMEQIYNIKQSFMQKLLPHRLLCFKPFTTLEIQTDGDCSFCCYIENKIGNIKNSSLQDVFNSDTAKDIRRRFYNNDYSYCDKMRCSVFSENKIYYENISSDDLLYRYDIHQNISIGSDTISLGPSLVVESVQGLCNVKCVFCWPFKRYPREYYINDAYTAITQLNNLQQVALAGGEPFYNPNVDDLLGYLIKKNISLSVTSNLTFLTESTKSLLLKVNLMHLHCSVNAASKEIYEKLVQGGNWGNVCSNLSFFKTIKYRKPDLRLNISMVVNKINYHEMVDFIILGDAYGVDYIIFYPLDDRHVSDELKLTICDVQNISKILDQPIFDQLSSKIASYALRNWVNDRLLKDKVQICA